MEAKKHIFCEKPFGTDPVNLRRFMAAAKKSEELKLTVKSGAQRRSQAWYLDQYKRLKNGEIGDIVAHERLLGGHAGAQLQQHQAVPQPASAIRSGATWNCSTATGTRFVWICGDQIVEQHLHNIDVCNWFMGAHPVEVVACGGAAWRPREEEYGNIYDHLSADFVYAERRPHVELLPPVPGREIAQNVSERIVGTKGVIDSAALRGAQPARRPLRAGAHGHDGSILGKGPYINEAHGGRREHA